MTKLWLLAVLIMPFQLIHAQEVHHAPTVEQCRADQKLWLSKVEVPDGAGLLNVGYFELGDWSQEMSDCEKVDPGNTSQYYNTGAEMDERLYQRMTGFIHRHNLWSQFLAEDAQGCHGSEPCKPQDKH